MSTNASFSVRNPPVKRIANLCIGVGAICLTVGVVAGILTIGVRALVRHLNPRQITTEDQMIEHMKFDRDIYLTAKDVALFGVPAGALLLLVGAVVKIAARDEHESAS